MIIPIYITFFLPIVSESLPEKGLEIAAEIENRKKINPFLFSPPILVMYSFNSGKNKLKLVMKNNREKQMSQKFREYPKITVQNYFSLRYRSI